jgi:hypothetical protein
MGLPGIFHKISIVPYWHTTNYEWSLQLAVGIILWTHGWDPSTSTKSNRTPMHTETVTLVFVDVSNGEVVGVRTLPNMGGAGKSDHDSVFQLFKNDLVEFESKGSN